MELFVNCFFFHFGIGFNLGIDLNMYYFFNLT